MRPLARKLLASAAVFTVVLSGLGLTSIATSSAAKPVGNKHDGQFIFRFDTLGD